MTPPDAGRHLLRLMIADDGLMIADDDPVVRGTLSMSMSEAFDVVGAADSLEAIELAETAQPDAAIVDVEMPEGGGLPAVRGIVEISPETAIVVLSEDESDAVVRAVLEAGAVTHPRKGVSTQALAETLTDSIRAHTAERSVALSAQSGSAA